MSAMSSVPQNKTEISGGGKVTSSLVLVRESEPCAADETRLQQRAMRQYAATFELSWFGNRVLEGSRPYADQSPSITSNDNRPPDSQKSFNVSKKACHPCM